MDRVTKLHDVLRKTLKLHVPLKQVFFHEKNFSHLKSFLQASNILPMVPSVVVAMISLFK